VEDIQKLYGKLIKNINMMRHLFYLILVVKKYLKIRIQMRQLFAMIITVWSLEIISIRIIISEITFYLKKFMKLYQNIAIIVMAMMFREKIMLKLMN